MRKRKELRRYMQRRQRSGSIEKKSQHHSHIRLVPVIYPAPSHVHSELVLPPVPLSQLSHHLQKELVDLEVALDLLVSVDLRAVGEELLEGGGGDLAERAVRALLFGGEGEGGEEEEEEE